VRFSTVQIEAFLALVETLQFSLAAERCHVSTSAFSQIIGRLEDELGVRLFDRSTRHVALTPEGETFLISARRIAHEIDAAVSEMRARIAGRSGQVTIAATPTPCVSWLPGIMQGFRAAYPQVALRLRDAISDRCLVMLTEGYADFSVMAQEGETAEFDSVALFEESFYLLCRADDPLAHGKLQGLAQLQGRDYIDVSGKGSWEQRKHDLKSAGVRDTGLEVANFGTLAGLIEAGFGIGLVPSMALPLCQRAGLVARPLTEPSFTRTFYLVKRRGRSLSVAADKMMRLVMEAAEIRQRQPHQFPPNQRNTPT
jgi:DNA-binding transcriptional LysR family regulator